MIIREQKPYNTLILNMMDKLPNINKWRRMFLLETFILFLSIRGRINFLQLARYGKYKEQRYRQQFEKRFDFLTFNKELTLSQGSGRYAIAFDPSYVSKSGKHTPGVGWYWSGCANRGKALKRNIMLVHVTYSKTNGKNARKLYFSTDISMDPNDVLLYYHSRFQIEFLYRDGKQHTGLNDSQARRENKLHFQFNASLTSINIAKAIHWLSIPKEERGTFSMADIKTMNHNILMLNRFFDVFGIYPHSAKNNKHVRELILYGTMAA